MDSNARKGATVQYVPEYTSMFYKESKTSNVMASDDKDDTT
jgi:hypothetical protein